MLNPSVIMQRPRKQLKTCFTSENSQGGVPMHVSQKINELNHLKMKNPYDKTTFIIYWKSVFYWT